VLAGYSTVEERGAATGRGEGGDTTLVIDAAAEDVIFEELEALAAPVVAVSEERGEVAIAGGGSTRVVIDPVDGSLNAKRRLPFAAVSIAVASGPGMRDVDLGYVAELEPARDWWAVRGGGAFLDGEPLERLEPGALEILGLEGVTPDRVAAAASAIGGLDARRVRALGSVAVTLCMVAWGGLDAMISLRPMRSVDAAAAQLLVREVGGTVLFPEAGPDAALDLEMRSRVVGARDAEMAERLLATF
jgi:myo-inositol-1(or 4)-monophosphatase